MTLANLIRDVNICKWVTCGGPDIELISSHMKQYLAISNRLKNYKTEH